MDEKARLDSESLKQLVELAANLFKMIDNKDDAFDAIHTMLQKISKIIEEVANRGGLTEENSVDYSFSSCGVVAILYTLESNPIFEQGVFCDQAMHHFRNVLDHAKQHEITPPNKKEES